MGKKILHVDDDPEWLELVREVLVTGGYEVSAFATLAEAKAAAQKECFDIFICDMNIQALQDGSDWAYELQEAGQTAIVFSTLPALSTHWLEHWLEKRKKKLAELPRLVGQLAK